MTVVVQRLRVRVTGLPPAEAARLGDELARDLARRLASGRPARSLGAVRVHVRPHEHDRIAAIVARSVR